jgi:hypothetical protein
MAPNLRPPLGCQKFASVDPRARRNWYQSQSVTPYARTDSVSLTSPPGRRPFRLPVSRCRARTALIREGGDGVGGRGHAQDEFVGCGLVAQFEVEDVVQRPLELPVRRM